MKCTNVHILITLIVIVAGIVLVVLLYLLNLTVTNGTINGIIFYANIVSINESVFLLNDNLFKPLKVFISFINLDLGIETCYYNGMDNYAKMWLQLFFPLYLILITTFIIIASRYSYRIQRLTYTRSLPVLVTLLLLSYTGILRAVSTVLFSYSTITELPSGDQQLVWSIDASVPLFGVKFTILFITCLVLFLILIPFNLILLFIRFLLKFKIINRFKPLLDAFHESQETVTAIGLQYKLYLGICACIKSNYTSNCFSCFVNILYYDWTGGYLQQYKNKHLNIQELILFMNLTILFCIPYQGNDRVIYITANAMIIVVLFHSIAIVLYHFLTYTCHCNVIMMLLYIKKKFM